MKVTKTFCDNHMLVTISGDFRADSIIEVRESFEQIQHEVDETVLFDLSQMRHIDSSGIGLLVYIYKRIRPRELQMILIGLNGQPKRLFEMLHINRVIECIDSMSSYSQQHALCQ
jgi:anti-anti-sigma factor